MVLSIINARCGRQLMAGGLFDAAEIDAAEKLTGVTAGHHPQSARRYHAVVLGSSPLDVVRAAGGLIFDRTRLGWKVVALLTACREDRPLRILGAGVVGDAHPEQLRAQIPHLLVVGAHLLRDDPTVRRWARKSVEHGLTDVAVWYEGGLTPRAGASQMQHRLSGAARVFKATALQAAGAPAERCELPEVFRMARVVSGVLKTGPASAR
jgi:hypothetical protein